jgi:hypothetical protein
MRDALEISAKGALWSTLRYCYLEHLNGVITITATENEGRSGFAWFDPELVFAAPDQDPEMVGLMTRLALRHCR